MFLNASGPRLQSWYTRSSTAEHRRTLHGPFTYTLPTFQVAEEFALPAATASSSLRFTAPLLAAEPFSVAGPRVWNCLVSSITFPFIRSNRIELYFFRIRSIHGTETATSLRNGSADTDYVNGYRKGYERKRNAGNQAVPHPRASN